MVAFSDRMGRLGGFAWLLPVLLALCIYPLLWPSAPFMGGDSKQYMAAALDLADGRLDRLHRVTPGYPLVVYLTGSAQAPSRALFLVQLLLHCVSVVMVVSIARWVGLNKRSIFLLACILALPPYVEYSSYVLTESLSGFLLVTGLYCLLRHRSAAWAAAGGLAFGYLALVRPTFTLLGIVVALTVVALGDRKQALVVAASSLVFVAPFLAYNRVKFGYLGMSPQIADTIAMKTARFVEELPPSPVRDYLLQVRDRELVGGLGHTGELYVLHSDRQKLARLTGLSGPALEAYLAKLQLRLIASAPIAFLVEVWTAFGSYWSPSICGGRPRGLASRELQLLWAVLHVCLVGVFAAALLALCGTSLTYRLRASDRFVLETYQICAVSVFYTMVASCVLADGLARYRRPTDSVILLMAFLGTAVWLRERAYARACLETVAEGSSYATGMADSDTSMPPRGLQG